VKPSIINKDAKYLEVSLAGEDHSFPNLLREALMEDSDVEFASYRIDHPQLGVPKLYIRTSGKKPEKALLEAIKKVRKRISEFNAVLDKEKEHKAPKKEHKEKESKKKK
jgi:DNA-directed RNA polymerase subunit L